MISESNDASNVSSKDAAFDASAATGADGTRVDGDAMV